MTDPLDAGEHIDLDTGLNVLRGDGSRFGEEHYRVWDGVRDKVVLEDEEIRQLAELAGYEVRDP